MYKGVRLPFLHLCPLPVCAELPSVPAAAFQGPGAPLRLTDTLWQPSLASKLFRASSHATQSVKSASLPPSHKPLVRKIYNVASCSSQTAQTKSSTLAVFSDPSKNLLPQTVAVHQSSSSQGIPQPLQPAVCGPHYLTFGVN